MGVKYESLHCQILPPVIKCKFQLISVIVHYQLVLSLSIFLSNDLISCRDSALWTELLSLLQQRALSSFAYSIL